MNIIVATGEEITKLVGDQFNEQLDKNPKSVLGMTTGSTPLTLGFFKDWIERSKAGKMDFSEATIINPDELLGLPEGHPETYKVYMEQHFFHGVDVAEERKHIPHSHPDDAEEECRAFEKMLDHVGGVDLQLSGLGGNGHVAFIEPGKELPADTFVVNLEDESRPHDGQFGEGEQVPTQAITVGIGTLLKSRKIVLVAVGEGKADIVKTAFTGPITTEVPASFLQLHPNITVYLDEGSAAKLPENLYTKVSG